MNLASGDETGIVVAYAHIDVDGYCEVNSCLRYMRIVASLWSRLDFRSCSFTY